MNEKLLKRDDATTKRAAGVLGATAVACVACCAGVPLAAPLLAWFGLSGLGAISTGWYAATAAVFATGLAVLFLLRRRRARACEAPPAEAACNCQNACTHA